MRKAQMDLIVLKDAGEDIAKQVNLHIMAMQQQLKALIQEQEFIDTQYTSELRLAKEESAAEIESARFERDIARQQTLYDKIMARFDELDIMSDAEGLKVIPLESPKYGYQIGPSLSLARWACTARLVSYVFWDSRIYLSGRIALSQRRRDCRTPEAARPRSHSDHPGRLVDAKSQAGTQFKTESRAVQLFPQQERA